MTCERCRAAHAHAVDDEKAEQFRNASDRICGCENFRLSDHSPGPVADGELLHMLVMDPQSIVDGWLHPSRIKRFTTSGQSVLRDGASDAEFELTAAQLQANAYRASKKTRLAGILSFLTANVRYCMTDRLLCVFDTAMEEKPNHADLMCSGLGPLSEDWSKNKRKKEEYEYAREVIIALGRMFNSPETFRNGMLAKYANPDT